MKHCAISITSKEHAELVDIAAPGSLGANEVRGRTVCTLISPHSIHTGFDTALRWLADELVRTDGLITQTDPRDAQRAYQDLLHRREEGLFTVFDLSLRTSQYNVQQPTSRRLRLWRGTQGTPTPNNQQPTPNNQIWSVGNSLLDIGYSDP
jgi:hypothetical protein